MKEIFLWFSSLKRLNTWLWSSMKQILVSHFKAAQNLVADLYEKYFDMIFT